MEAGEVWRKGEANGGEGAVGAETRGREEPNCCCWTVFLERRLEGTMMHCGILSSRMQRRHGMEPLQATCEERQG